METPEGFYLLMKKLPGEHIWDVFSQDYRGIADTTGQVTADIHSALASIKGVPEHVQTMEEELRGWVHTELATGIWVSNDDWATLTQSLFSLYPALPKQYIHRDLHYGNMLFEGNQLTGILDFDLGKWDARLFDLAYFLLGQLLGYQEHMVQQQWLCFIHDYVAAYEKNLPLQQVEKAALALMMQGIELLFVAFWQQQGQPKEAEEALALYSFAKRNAGMIREAIQ